MSGHLPLVRAAGFPLGKILPQWLQAWWEDVGRRLRLGWPHSSFLSSWNLNHEARDKWTENKGNFFTPIAMSSHFWALGEIKFYLLVNCPFSFLPNFTQDFVSFLHSCVLTCLYYLILCPSILRTETMLSYFKVPKYLGKFWELFEYLIDEFAEWLESTNPLVWVTKES